MSLNYFTGEKLDNICDPVFHHNIPRLVPKDITAYYEDGTIWERLTGTGIYDFVEDIYVGDYFKMSRPITAYNRGDSSLQETGSQYVTIASINGDYRTGSGMMFNHFIMIPGQGFGGTFHFGTSRMCADQISITGYVRSEMHTTTIGPVTSVGSTLETATINQQLYAEFGSHLKTTLETLTKSSSRDGYNRFGTPTGCSTGTGTYMCQARLMSEVEVFGSIVWSSSGYDTGNANRQLDIFRVSRAPMGSRVGNTWLKDLAEHGRYCVIGSTNYASTLEADDAGGYVRPRFVLGA